MEHLASRFGNPVTLDGLCVLGSFHPWKFVTLRQRPASIESYSAWPVSQPPVACDPGASGSLAASGAVGCRLQAARPEVKHPGFGLSPSPLWPVTLELLAASLLQEQWAAGYRPLPPPRAILMACCFEPHPRLSFFSNKNARPAGFRVTLVAYRQKVAFGKSSTGRPILMGLSS